MKVPTCPRCPGSPRLEVVQPLSEEPSRLLCACRQCRTWFFRFEPPEGRTDRCGGRLRGYQVPLAAARTLAELGVDAAVA
jgi:hypothetical protein